MAVYPYTQPYYQRGTPQYPATVNAASRMPDTGGLFSSTTSSPSFASGGTAPTGISQSTSIGSGTGGFWNQRQADLSYADPNILGPLESRFAGLTYSVPGGGYLTAEEANNANSYYSKFGGSDPAANAAARAFYSYIGTLPTRAVGTPALQNLYSQTGYKPPPGPSINSLRPGWTGPFEITQRDVNMYGAYNPYQGANFQA